MAKKTKPEAAATMDEAAVAAMFEGDKPQFEGVVPALAECPPGTPVFRYVEDCAAGYVVLYGVRFETGNAVPVADARLAAKLGTNSHFERVG